MQTKPDSHLTFQCVDDYWGVGSGVGSDEKLLGYWHHFNLIHVDSVAKIVLLKKKTKNKKAGKQGNSKKSCKTKEVANILADVYSLVASLGNLYIAIFVTKLSISILFKRR